MKSEKTKEKIKKVISIESEIQTEEIAKKPRGRPKKVLNDTT